MSRRDPWRYRCPEHHASWHRQPGDTHAGNYYCDQCDDYFENLVDMKRGESKADVVQ